MQIRYDVLPVWKRTLMYVACTFLYRQGITVKRLPQGILIQQRFYNFTSAEQDEINKICTRLPNLAEKWASRLELCEEYLQLFKVKSPVPDSNGGGITSV